jgi:hypothetical protein
LLIARHTAMIAAASSRIDQTSRSRSVEPRRALTPVECSSTATAAIGSKRVGAEQIKRRCQRPRRQMRLGDLLESLSGSQAGRSRSTSDQEARRPPERRRASPEAAPLHECGWQAPASPRTPGRATPRGRRRQRLLPARQRPRRPRPASHNRGMRRSSQRRTCWTAPCDWSERTRRALGPLRTASPTKHESRPPTPGTRPLQRLARESVGADQGCSVEPGCLECSARPGGPVFKRSRWPWRAVGCRGW